MLSCARKASENLSVGKWLPPTRGSRPTAASPRMSVAVDTLSITVPCRLRFRDAVGALLRQVCEQLEHEDAADGLGDKVVSAFNEAFNNLTQYAYDPPDEGQVDIILEIQANQLAIELQDTGNTFAYDTVPTPELDELPESGLGIFIIRSLMSEVSYQPGGNGEKNRFRMTRTLKDDPAATPPQGTKDDA